MSKKIFIVNAHEYWAVSPGKLNKTLTHIAQETLQEKKYEVQVTTIQDGWDNKEEVQKILDCDVLIYQYPVYWFGPPAKMKKYIDDVYMEGYGTLFQHDGRVLGDDTKKYGSGGLLKNKHYMLSMTWNAPSEAFTDPKQFFDGRSPDEVFVALHKANQFLGLKQLPTFVCHDVVKNPDLEGDFKRFQAHLVSHI